MEQLQESETNWSGLQYLENQRNVTALSKSYYATPDEIPAFYRPTLKGRWDQSKPASVIFFLASGCPWEDSSCLCKTEDVCIFSEKKIGKRTYIQNSFPVSFFIM